jgi:hypothetical protein
MLLSPILAAPLLALIVAGAFLVRDKGKIDIDGPDKPFPEISRSIAVATIGIAVFLVALNRGLPIWWAALAGAGAAGGLSLGHWGSYGLWASLPAERYEWLYGRLVPGAVPLRTSRQWLTYPVLAANGAVVSLGAGIALFLSDAGLGPTILAGAAGATKLPAYAIAWALRPPRMGDQSFWHGNTIGAAIAGASTGLLIAVAIAIA